MVFIKQMICTGFKSFRKRTIINFDKGFTAIVGANGSGKSNIIDAFVFVLGELSAKTLRANNIKDLISNGGNGMGESDTATVELIFDNHDRTIPYDHDEISILRKIDRDGNGIYKLNNKRATRKEIMDLLDLAGLMPNSSNMIMQGELFRLINMNAIERRQLVEDIAGIASYNDKKTSAEQELNTVQTNLGQITLLLNEVHGQLEQLEKEKNDALHYLALVKDEKIRQNALQFVRIRNSEQKIIEIMTEKKESEDAVVRIHDLEEKLQMKINDLQMQIDQLNEKIKGLQDKELLQITQELNRVKDHITELKTSLKFAEKNLLKTENDQNLIKEKITSLTDQKQRMQVELTQFREQKTQLTDNMTLKTTELEHLEEKLKEIDSEYLSVKEELNQILTTLNHQKDLKNQKITTLKVLENEIAGIVKQKQKAEEKIYRTHQEIGNLKSQLRGLQSEKANLLAETGIEEFSKEQIEHQIKMLEQNINQIQYEQKQLDGEIRKKQANIVELRSKAAVIKQMNAGSRAIEGLMKVKQSNSIPGIFGTIADLGSADSKYSAALEMAAGGKFNWVVVDHQYTAEACIEYLKKNNLGRATFIPLSAIKVSTFDEEIPNDPKIHGRAIELINFDPMVTKAFEFVFGRSIIVDDMPTAVKLKLPVKRVTLDGDVVESTNVMSGGQKMKPTGIGFKSTDDQLLSQYEQDVARMQRDLESKDQAVKLNQKQISELYRRKISGDKETQQITQKIAICKSKIDQMTEEIQGAESEVADYLKFIEQKEQEKKEINEELLKIELEIQGIEEKYAQTQAHLNNSEESVIKTQTRELEREIKKINKTLADMDIKIAKTETMLFETIEANRQDAERQYNLRIDEIQKLNSNIQEYTIQFQTEQIKATDLEQKVQEKSSIVSELLTQRKKLVTEQSNLKIELARYADQLHPLKMKINTLEMKKGELEGKILDFKTLVLPDIEVGADLLEQDESTHQNAIEFISKEKTALGPVNLRAIEKYQEIDTRYKELEQKHEIIIEERESILEFIQNLESEKKKVFMNTYNSINKNFGYIFGRLSPGGEAKLELDNLEDPFSGGIQILARPGEKKWCLTQAMSGGEKTLTIIALILGIQMHVPSAYYILDEIDAALDDANAALVADLIKDLSSRSQFVIITHRDVTMARTDHLLGVSNREGVTNVINLSIKSVLDQIARNKENEASEASA
jgi:chromosome segregation protein